MATTTFSLNLDPAISTADYGYIYFVAFDQAGNPVPINGQTGANSNVIKLIDDGVIQSVTTASINQGVNVGNSFPSNYYVVMQSSSSSAGDLSSTLSNKANITTTGGLSAGFNFTMVEAVLTPSFYDQIDISALNNYGPNLAIQVNNQPPRVVSSSGFNTSLDKIIEALPSAAVQGAGTATPMILGPNANAELWPTDIWVPYLDAVIANPGIAAGIKSQYFFGGTTLNLYKLGVEKATMFDSVDGSTLSSKPNFLLLPLFPGLPGANTDIIKMSYSDLQGMIYAPTFANDADGFVKSFLVSGFDAGLWGARATYTNPNTTNTAINTTGSTAKITLSNSWNWSQLYNYEAAAAKAQGVATIQVDNVLANATFDQYAATIAGFGNPYGYTFSDLLSVGGVTPAPSIWTGSQDAASVNINIFANSTTPSASSTPVSGFNTSPTGYLSPLASPPNDWAYQSAAVFVGQGQGNLLEVDTRLGGKYHPDANYPMTFRVYAPSSSKAGSDGFVTYDLATPDANSNPWASWVINSDYTISNAGPSNLNGFFLIDNVPTATNNDIGWYQLVIGELGSSLQTVYDIYSTNTNGTVTSFITSPGVDIVPIPGGDKLALAPGLISTYNPLAYFDYNDLKAGVMYQMVLDRPTPDKEGLDYWSNYLANGGSEVGMASAMVDALEKQAPSLSNEDFVNLLYVQGLGREPEGAGRDWWVEQLQNGASRAQVAVGFANEAEMWANDTVLGVYSAAGGISTVIDWNF
jgi:hypothetical protein